MFHRNDGCIAQVETVSVALPVQAHFDEMRILLRNLKEDRCRDPYHVGQELGLFFWGNVWMNTLRDIFKQTRDF